MNKQLYLLIEKITPEEQREVANFINFLIIRRKLEKNNILDDDISTAELTKMNTGAGVDIVGTKTIRSPRPVAVDQLREAIGDEAVKPLGAVVGAQLEVVADLGELVGEYE